MKKILLALSLFLCMGGCAAEAVPSAEVVPSDEAVAGDESALAWEGGEKLPVDAVLPDDSQASAVTWSCTSYCSTEYDECLSTAQGPLDECLCYNSYVACRRGCGKPGWMRICPSF